MSEKKQQNADNSHPPFSPLSEQTKDNQQDYTHAEIVEAKTAVILLNSATVFKKNEYIHWRLTCMFKPMTIGEKTETMEVLYLSHQRKHNWLSEYKNDDSNSIMMSAPSAPLSSTLFRHSLKETLSTQQKKQLLYVLTPRTNVITLTKICRLVYMMDLSSSLATVGNTKSQILLLEVFKTLRNSLEGIVHPFCLQISSNERIMIRPVIRLTIIADCSQFASNVNVIPILTNHPSMRVFIQNVQITLENVDHVISDLYSAFMLFQKDIAMHRKQMKRKRSSMGYDLEVDEGPVPSYERSVFDATSLPASMGVENGPSYAKDSNIASRKVKRKPRSIKSSRSSSSVWGMGKTGANLTRMLHAGAFALSLLPQQGRSQLILVSDGALKSHIHDNTVARQLAEQNVACHIIQIGFNQSFIPGRNFGFLPDVDTLKFLAQATGGTFLYSDECVRLNRPDYDPADEQERNKNGGSQQQQQHHHHHQHHHYRFIQSSNMKKQKGTTIDEEMENVNNTGEHHHRRRRQSSGEFNEAEEKKASSSALQDDWWWNLDPNIYHRHFLLRESNLEKIRTLTPFHPRHHFKLRSPPADHEIPPSSENDPYHHQLRLQQGNSGFISLTNFPWDPEGVTPPIEWRLLRYREYGLPDDFAPMIAARAREGFYLQSVLFDMKSVMTTKSSSSSSSDIHDKLSKKKKRKPTSSHSTATTTTTSEEGIQITLVLHWKPHIIIEYRIRATWLPMHHQQEQAPWGTLLSRATSPQVEVFIRCDAEFAHLLQNWNSLRRRAQMMMMMSMTGGVARDTNKNQLFFKGEPQAAQAYASIEKLKTYLQCLFEGDDLLRDWIDPKHDHFSPWPPPSQEQGNKEGQEGDKEPNIHWIEARFRSFWFSSRFSAEGSRALTRCWYDLDCIDMLVGDVSPYMDPKLESSWNQDFGPHVQETIQKSMSAVVKLLKTVWADFELTRHEEKEQHDEDEVENGMASWFVKLIQKSDSEDIVYSIPSLPTTTASSVASSSSPMTLSVDSEKSVRGGIDWEEFKLRPSFCQLKVKHEYGRLITLRFLFFNVDTTLRQDIKSQVMTLLEENTLLKDTPSRSDLICTRPLSRLLIRDEDHFKPDDFSLFSTSSSASSEAENDYENDGSKKKIVTSVQKIKQADKPLNLQTPTRSPSLLSPLRQQNQQKLPPAPSWYLPVGLWLTGEHIVHDYLLHSIWSWQTDNYQGAYHRKNKMMPVHDLAFQLLCQARLDQGYQLVLPRPDNTHFYQEITFPRDSLYIKRHHHRHQKGRKTDRLCAIQYFIRKDDTNDQGRIITELWVEPSVHHIKYQNEEEEEEEDDDDEKNAQMDQVTGKSKSDYDWIKTWTEVPDRRIISHLVTFDQIHAIGRTKGKGDFKPTTEDKAKKIKEDEDETSECIHDDMVKMLLPHLFDVSSVLKTNSFALVSYDIFSYRPGPADNGITETSIQGSRFSNSEPSLVVKELSTLPAHYHPYYIVHHYFDHELRRNVMDGEVVMTQHNPRRNFWSALKKAIKDQGGSNMAHVTCLKQVKCYVSIIDPRSFLIVLLPDLKHLMTTFMDVDMRQQRRQLPPQVPPNRFDCFFYECARQKPLRAKKQTDDISETNSASPNKRQGNDFWIPCLLDDDYDDDDNGKNRDGALFSIQPIIQPNLPFSAFLPDSVYCGHLQKKHATTTSINMSEKSQMFLYKVTGAYAQAFLRAIYTMLLTHTFGEFPTTPPLPLSDLMKAITICHTTVISVDVTRFVNIMACPSISLCEDMDHKWKMTLEPYFKPIKVIETRKDVNVITDIADILLYIPPPLLSAPSFFSLDVETPPGQHPLFLGFNITLGDDSDMTTLCEEPTSFDQLKKIMVAFSKEEYENEDDFLAKAFSIGQGPTETSSTPQLTLNLICKSIAVENQSNTRRSSASNDQIPADNKENDIYLTNEQTVILSETVSKIEWAFTEQVLNGLLILQKKQQETKKEILHYVVTELGKPYASTNHHQQTKFQLPLSFVSKDSQLCTNLFMDLLEKGDRAVDDKVNRSDPYFHIIWSPLTLWAAAIANTDTDTTVEEILINGNGLGISMEGEQEEEKREPQVPDSYWLIVAVHLRHIDIFYFAMSDQANPSTLVVDHTISYVRKIEKQTNQKLLLDMLQETRVCSKYLEAPLTNVDGGIPSSDSDSRSSGETKSSVETVDLTSPTPTDDNEETAPPRHHHHLMHFEVGQFQCPLVYRKEFLLHWRVPLGKALHYLKSDLLRPFTITNRADMYVIEREQAIVYCKLNEKSSPSMTNKGVTDTPQILPTTAPASINGLEMSVYGLECPKWIVQDVVPLIENRLVSEVTLEELQTFFTRNPTSKPTTSDVRFILPFDKRPPQTKILRLPHLVSDPSLLLRFFKRFLLAEGLKPFKGPHVISAIADASSYFFEDDENQDESDLELQKDDLCFYYNCTKRAPGVSSAFELACGQGMAGICMTLRDQQGRVMTNLPPKDTTKGFNFDPDDIRQSLDIELHVTSIQNNEHPYYVWVDVWTMGSVDDQILLQHIHDCYRRALCDYLIEETVTIDLGSVLLYEAAALQQAVSSDRARRFTSFPPSHRQLSTLLRKKFINSIVYMLQKSVDWQNPTVHSMKKPTKSDGDQWMMPPWCMKDIISHLEQELVQLDPSLEPTITWKKLGSQYTSLLDENGTQNNDDTSSEWLLYRGGPVFCRNNTQNNIRVVAISGLCEFVEQFGGAGSSPVTHFSPIHQAPPMVGPWKSNPASSSSSAYRPSVQHRHLYQHSHYYYPPYSQKRRTSLKSDPSRRSSASTEGNNNDSLLPSATSSTIINEQQQTRRVSYQTRSRGSSTSIQHPSILGDDSVISTYPPSQAPSLVPRADPEKHCFLIMIMDVGRLVLYAYNWTEQQSARLFNRFFSVVHQQHMRSQVLNGILHQKMGLFHHSLPFEDMALQYVASSVVSGADHQEKLLVSPHSGYHSAAAAAASTPAKATVDDRSSKGRPSLKKTKSELKVITQDSNITATPSGTATSTPITPRNWTIADMSIQNVINMDLPLTAAIISTPRSNTKKNRSSEGRLSTSPNKKKEKDKKQKSQRRAWSFGGGSGTTKLDPLSMANPELNYVLMDAISEPVHAPQHHMLKWKGMRYAVNDDILRRHGDPYLDTYLQQATVVSVHQKALQVYLKWRKRFGGAADGVNTPLVASPTSDTSGHQQEQQEKLTRYEVSEILRSSRLLHFCRAPFFFFTGTTATNAPDGEDQKIHEQHVSDNAANILDWYRQFLRTFVVNYSSYLEKLNLQVVEFAPSEYDEPLPLLPSPLLNSAEDGGGHEDISSFKDNRDGYGNNDDEENATNITDDNSTQHGEEFDLNTSKFDTGIHGLTIEHPSTYLLKVSDAGSIICEVRFTHTFVSVSLYGIHRQQGVAPHFLSGLSRQQSREAKQLHLKKFEQGVGQLKHLIHINSFVYDFHLYYIQQLLIQLSSTRTILPTLGVSLMSTLRRFHSFYVTPTHYSTNRLFSGVYECKHHLARHQKPYVDLNYFFKYLYKDHTNYGLNAVTDPTSSSGSGSGSNVTGVYLTSTSIYFDSINSTEEEPAWKYTLILCPMTEKTLRSSTLDQNPQESPASVTATSVLIRYFILAVYQPERTPSSLVKNFWTTPTSSSSSSSSSYHPNIIVNARNKIDDIVSKVIKACQQRFSWRALIPPELLRSSDHHRHNQIDRMMDGAQCYSLVSKFQSFSLLAGDNMEHNLVRLISIKKDIQWHKIFDMFLRLHHGQYRSFMYKIHRHLLFYHPTHCMDFLLHIIILNEEEAEADDDRIDIILVRREPRFIDSHHHISPLTTDEQEQVANLGQSLCYTLWKFTQKN